MKLVVFLLSIIIGGWMLADGIFVMMKGKFIGPEKPGPWAEIFYRLSVNVFKLGPLFILFGLAWLIFVIGAWTNQPWAFLLGVTISILTLWYLPAGTLLSMIVLGILLFFKQRLGF